MGASLPEKSKLSFELPKKIQTICFALIGAGLVLTLLQLFFPGWHPHEVENPLPGSHTPSAFARMWMSIHMAGIFAFSLGIGGIFFVAISHISGARWSISMRRLSESFFASLIVPFIMMIAILTLGIGDVFGHWVHPLPTDELIQHKAGWLNIPFFIIRNVVIVLIWIAFGYIFWKKSVDQDDDGAIKKTRTLAKISAVFLIIYGITYSIHSFDQTMSLEPHWFSTLFAVYTFSGMALTVFAAMVLWIAYLKSGGYYGTSLNINHFHDLGKYIFSFTIFWAYMAISQYMLIWYAGIPEETGFYFTRFQGGWYYASAALVMLRFVLPFFLLLKREVKRNYKYMSAIAILIIIGQIVDIYVFAYPTLDHGSFIMFSWQEVGPLLFVAGSFVLITGKFLEKALLVPVKDPRLEDCLHFHQ